MDASTSDNNRTRGFVTTFVDHPRLLCLDDVSIRVFLRRYDDYCKEVAARAGQLLNGMNSEPIHTVSINFCVDSEQPPSVLDVGFIEGVDEEGELENNELRVSPRRCPRSRRRT